MSPLQDTRISIHHTSPTPLPESSPLNDEAAAANACALTPCHDGAEEAADDINDAPSPTVSPDRR